MVALVSSQAKNCVVKKKNCIVGVDERAGGMCCVDLQRASDKEIATFDVTENILSVWHASLAHVDRNTIKKMAESGALHGMEMAEDRSTNKCSAFVDRTMTNTTIRSHTTLETRPGIVLQTGAVRMNVP